MHVRRRVPFLKIVPLDAVFAKFGIAKPQLIFSQVTHLLAPIAVRRSAANDEAHRVDDRTMVRNVNVNQLKASYY
jgi:hypothetical protein